MNAITPLQALNKAFRKVRPTQSEIDSFKQHLGQMKAGIDPSESEAYHENLFRDFMMATYYRGKHAINRHERQDLAIHLGKRSSDKVGVIIEAKRPGSSEMATLGNINTKAIQELLLYYLRERINHQNDEVKHLIITDLNHYFIFDAQIFDKAFARDKAVVARFKDWQDKRLTSNKTGHFYENIASKEVAAKLDQLTYTYIDLNDYDAALRSSDNKGIRKLVALYKIFSPQHLLKQPFVNDSNTLDKAFYAELLHIIGLTEVTVSGKKLIQRKKPADRDSGSLLELTIHKLDSLGKLSRIPKVSQYGSTQEDRLFGVGLELVIIWINRILFLKLLEAQLIAYNESEDYHFLQPSDMPDFDEVSKLFFDVLAKRVDERADDLHERYGEVPYLNSSLFEMQDLEHDGIGISNLDNHRSIAVHSKTVLKDGSKRLTGDLETLPYLLRFLNAYNFASEGGDDVQKDNKNLINASVLGLIFEKINGYKDGSFFTPGFITMYMCRETIRRAVVQKFNASHAWSCDSIADVYNKIDDKTAANETINSLTICDPAVGSGHFLVSALNEIIHIKHELGILVDDQGHRLRDYDLSIENDELIIEDDRGELFQYRPRSSESQRVQRTIFREKQTIIESCLFGVDINPNSVKICQLRLWIELLKHSYYRDDGQLETLPNIDINIKCGNSLISRFGLEEDLSPALKKSQFTIDSYKVAVSSYKRATDKDSKRSFTQLIDTIKGDFRSVVRTREKKQLQKLEGEMYYKYGTALDLDLELTKAQKAKTKKAQDKLQGRIDKLRSDIEEVQNNAIYDNAFEWRFEFPEVLDEEGKYLGFDVVIGNPPYIRQEEFSPIKHLLKDNYSVYKGTADMYVYFVERAFMIMRDRGHFVYIIPNKWMRAGYGDLLRPYLLDQKLIGIYDFGDLPVFEEATTYPCIIEASKSGPTTSFDAAEVETLEYGDGLENYLKEVSYEINSTQLQPSGWTLTRPEVQAVLDKIRSQGVPLGEYVDGKIYRGVLTGYNKAFVIDEATKDRLIAEDSRSAEIIKPLLAGKDIKRYQTPVASKWVILFKNGQTKSQYGDLTETQAWARLQQDYPSVTEWLQPFADDARKRSDQGDYWWELRACAYYDDFEQEKIMLPDISIRCEAIYDQSKYYAVNTAYIILGTGLVELGLLNSNLLLYFYSNLTSTIRGGYLRFIRQYLAQIPIVDMSDSEKTRTKSLVTQIIDLKQADQPTQHLEYEIDVLVYRLYGLTYDEVLVVDAGFAMTREDYEGME